MPKEPKIAQMDWRSLGYWPVWKNGKKVWKRDDYNMEIPDPFQTFVTKKYANAKGYVHDWFSGEWSYKCSACKEDLSAPSRKIMTKIRLFHTRNECLGGY